MKYNSVFYYLCCLLIAPIGYAAVNSFTTTLKETSFVNAKEITDTVPKPVVVHTNAVMNITSTTAECTFTLITNGIKVTAFGVCISKSSGPTIANQKYSVEKGGIGTSFRSVITGLTPVLKYYIRAYATYTTGTVYGNELSFTTLRPK
jgi:hypothetical protein